MHSYHVVEELFKENSVELKLMAGSTKNHVTFRIMSSKFPLERAYGSCAGATVILGIVTKHRAEFDLRDPDSISEMIEYIESGKMWVK